MATLMIFNDEDLKEYAYSVFDNGDPKEIMDFFGKIQWRDPSSGKLLPDATEGWDRVIQDTLDWECNTGKTIAKGTPFYFAGSAHMLNGDLDIGFLMMHQALEEDKLWSAERESDREYVDAPALRFVTLDYQNTQQFLFEYVRNLSDFLKCKIDRYRKCRKDGLTLEDFGTKFLKRRSKDDKEKDELFLALAFHFVFALSRLKRIEETPQKLRESSFSSQLWMDIFFDIAQCIEQELREQSIGLFDLLKRLVGETELRNWSDEQEEKFDELIERLIEQDKTIKGDLIMAYLFRNRAAHDLRPRDEVAKHATEIAQRLLNALFYVIESPSNNNSQNVNVP